MAKKAKCVSCPFNDGFTEEATQAQNYGCLPSHGEMIRLLESGGVAMSCHSNEATPCRGLAEVRDVSAATILPHTDWYQGITT